MMSIEVKMTKTITAKFEGGVLRPESPVDLEQNARYRISIDTSRLDEKDAQANAWDVLESLSGTVDAAVDWSAEHDHYIHGTPKRARTP
jgi:predicted DNA-binding antitoxin AbrB/MazE fold protein